MPIWRVQNGFPMVNPHDDKVAGLKCTSRNLLLIYPTWRICWRGCTIFVPDRRDGAWRIRYGSPVGCARHSEQRDPRTKTGSHAWLWWNLGQTQEFPVMSNFMLAPGFYKWWRCIHGLFLLFSDAPKTHKRAKTLKRDWEMAHFFFLSTTTHTSVMILWNNDGQTHWVVRNWPPQQGHLSVRLVLHDRRGPS